MSSKLLSISTGSDCTAYDKLSGAPGAPINPARIPKSYASGAYASLIGSKPSPVETQFLSKYSGVAGS